MRKKFKELTHRKSIEEHTKEEGDSLPGARFLKREATLLYNQEQPEDFLKDLHNYQQGLHLPHGVLNDTQKKTTQERLTKLGETLAEKFPSFVEEHGFRLPLLPYLVDPKMQLFKASLYKNLGDAKVTFETSIRTFSETLLEQPIADDLSEEKLLEAFYHNVQIAAKKRTMSELLYVPSQQEQWRNFEITLRKEERKTEQKTSPISLEKPSRTPGTVFTHSTYKGNRTGQEKKSFQIGTIRKPHHSYATYTYRPSNIVIGEKRKSFIEEENKNTPTRQYSRTL